MSKPKYIVTLSWAHKHLNTDIDGLEGALDKAFGKGNWKIAK